MSLHHSPQGNTDRKVLLAVAAAIKNLETITGCIGEYDIDKDDAEAFLRATRSLWSILESNGYTIDLDTNRLRRKPP